MFWADFENRDWVFYTEGLYESNISHRRCCQGVDITSSQHFGQPSFRPITSDQLHFGPPSLRTTITSDHDHFGPPSVRTTFISDQRHFGPRFFFIFNLTHIKWLKYYEWLKMSHGLWLIDYKSSIFDDQNYKGIRVRVNPVRVNPVRVRNPTFWPIRIEKK